MKKQKNTIKPIVKSDKLSIERVKQEHLGKVTSFEGTSFVLSTIDLVRHKEAPQKDVIIKAVNEKQLQYLYNTHRFFFKD